MFTRVGRLRFHNISPFLMSGICVCLALVTLLAGVGFAQQQHSSSTLVSGPHDLGPEDLSKTVSVTVWLRQHNKETFDALVQQMYDKSSAGYHHWLTMAQYKALFAPTRHDAAQVQEYLKAHNLTVTGTEKNNHYVIARGTVGDVQNAMNVQIHRFNINGTVQRAATGVPSVAGSVGAAVAAVQVGDLKYSSYAAPSKDLDTGRPFPGVPLSQGVGSAGLFFTANCFRPPETKTFKTASPTGPMAVYSGNRYGANITSPAPNLPSCGYDAAEMQTAYGLNKAFAKGWDGTGQTIVIVDAFGSNTILDDANTFSKLNHLPELTGNNFQIFTPNGPVNCGTDCMNGNWQFETTLDVEWAHAIAPHANIALVLGADNSFTNLDIANLFAIQNLLGSVVSNSFGIPEVLLIEFFPSELVVENSLSELAAALGMSQQISTGDSGDNLAVDQENGVDSVSAGANSTSPFATAIGGTSTFLNSNKTIKFQTGWGLNVTRIAEPTPNPPTIPPLSLGFEEGSGGGASFFFAKPKYQASLRGRFRQTPDIAMNADPQTGVEIIVTLSQVPGGEQFVEVFGGTSLSCPMFSAMWAIANQVAGVPLGQAAPYLYKLDSNAISDVTDLTSPFNVSGIIFNPPNPPAFESPDDLAAPLNGTVNYISALFQSSSSTRWDVFTFGTDSSLKTGPGWDNVTGLGTPIALRFFQEVAALAP